MYFWSAAGLLEALPDFFEAQLYQTLLYLTIEKENWVLLFVLDSRESGKS